MNLGSAILSILLAMFGMAYLIYVWESTAILHDPGDMLESAYIDHGHVRHEMNELAFGWHMKKLDGEGTFYIRCRNGSFDEAGYLSDIMGGETMSVDEDCKLR